MLGFRQSYGWACGTIISGNDLFQRMSLPHMVNIQLVAHNGASSQLICWSYFIWLNRTRQFPWGRS